MYVSVFCVCTILLSFNAVVAALLDTKEYDARSITKGIEIAISQSSTHCVCVHVYVCMGTYDGAQYTHIHTFIHMTLYTHVQL